MIAMIRKREKKMKMGNRTMCKVVSDTILFSHVDENESLWYSNILDFSLFNYIVS